MTTPHFNFIGRRRTWAILSGTLLLVSVGALLVRGLNLSIDFVGGTSFLVEDVQTDVTSQQLREAAEGAGAEDVKAQVRLEGDVATGAIVQTAALDPGGATEQDVKAALADLTGAETVDVTFVGPSWGERITGKALEALVVFLIVVVAYISLRLEPKMAGTAVVALVHDVGITVGLYALVGFTVSPSTIIALLTILGYSLYDTVVVFDRVEDAMPYLGEPGSATYSELVNTSLNHVLWRSINTSLTSILPVGSLLFVGSRLLGAATLQDLALALFIGMALGTYSSIFVAGPLLATWREREPEMQRLAKRSRQKGRTRKQLIEEADEPEEIVDPASPAAQAPITTDYVRGRGKKKRRGR